MSETAARSSSWQDPISSLVRISVQNRALVRELVLRDLRGAYAGHGLGSLWVFAQPLVVVITFMLIFGVVIGSRIAVTSSFPGDYNSYILSGLVPWLIMQNALGRAPSVFSVNANLVKQVVFPVEVLPVSSLLACFILYIPCILVLIFYKLFIGGGLSMIALALPIVLFLNALFILGIMLLVSVVTPFLRDIKEFVVIYSTISMYFTPAVYLPDWVPTLLKPVLYVNPFSYVVWVYQDTLFFGDFRHPFAWAVFAIMGAATFLAGLIIFRRVKPVLGNVL